jgi:hypothetical protein
MASKNLSAPYFKMVPREEVFGSGDTGRATVIKLIDNVDNSLIPDKDAPVEYKQEYDSLTTVLKDDDFTECPISGYFEYKRSMKENDLKYLMEAKGFNEYD